MIVFLDFEASSLGKRSYPVEVAWVFEDGREEAHLIRPAPEWTDWDEEAAAIHGISRALLVAEGEPPETVAARMAEVLGGHDLVASAPSWDGKWLSTLLRAARLPRHQLRLRRSRDARRECAAAMVGSRVAPEHLDRAVDEILAAALEHAVRTPPAHRALPDAREERDRWNAVRSAAQAWLQRAG
ncbi:3'-5' exonuclease [Novosphingobium soli]|uniref:Transcriptional regulator n=1 Tax=Novosphingobium soli TaxID=574956 RepID=A0ABV6CYK3_9SPHN